MNRGELNLALRLDEDLLRLSRLRNDSGGLVLGHLSSGRTLFFAGRFGLSRSHLEEVPPLYDPISHGALVHQASLHPQVVSRGDSEAAEELYHNALSIAEEQGAKLWELRAAVSLAVYAWFTEEFDTADLKDAKALLDELA